MPHAKRIRHAEAELDYRPNHAARSLKIQRTDVVGLIVPDVTDAIFSELMAGAEDDAHRRGFIVLLARAEGVSGLVEPEDLSVVAIHDASTAEHTWPPLTTVRMPRELGRAAMGAVIDRLQTGIVADIVVRHPSPEIVIRAPSSAPNQKSCA